MSDYKAKVLVVDDNPINLRVMVNYLETAGFSILVAEDGEDALEQLENIRPDIILLDVMMPGIDGFETCRRIKSNPHIADIPVIFMTALNETTDKVKGFQLGAVDYVTKPIQHEEMLARVTNHVTIRTLQKQLSYANNELKVANDELEQRVAERTHKLQLIADENARLLAEQETTIVKLQELDRLKSEFLTSMSHELRTPLNSILGFSELLMLDLTDKVARNDAELIHSSGQILLAIINDILDVSKLEAGLMEIVPEPLNVVEIMPEIFASSVVLVRNKAIKIEMDVPDILPVVHADKLRLKQVLLNLIGNAVKFTSTGMITIKASLEGDFIRFGVIDMGIGVPKEKQELIFRQFQQVDMSGTRSYGGVGLGLAISKKLVEMHGGEIGVVSEEGVGSEFWFTVPIK
jgi:signal transduction histidine kinase